jgi:hypothetical protein
MAKSDLLSLEIVSEPLLWQIAEYEPHPAQRKYHASKERFRVAACGRRFGKSMMGAMGKLKRLFVPKARGWIVSDTYFTGEEEFNYIEEAMEKILREYKISQKNIGHAHNVRTGEMYIEMPWGARVEVRSAQHPKALVSKGLAWVIMAEAAKMPRYIWEQLVSPALADWRGEADFLSTPEGMNWFKELHDRGADPRNQMPQAKYEGSYRSFNFPAWANTRVYPGGFDDPDIKRQMITPEGTAFFWQELGAKFGVMVGMIYGMFNRQIHVIDHVYNPDWPNYVFIDWGYNTFAGLDVQVSPDDKAYIWREHYTHEKQTYENLINMKDRKSPKGYRIDCIFADSAMPQDIQEAGRRLGPILARPEAKEWPAGPKLVQKFLMDEQHNPRLFVDRSCIDTIDEFENYKFPTKLGEMGEYDKPVNEGKPPKAKDHALDAIRYGLMHLYNLGYRHWADTATVGVVGGTHQEMDPDYPSEDRAFEREMATLANGMVSTETVFRLGQRM